MTHRGDMNALGTGCFLRTRKVDQENDLVSCRGNRIRECRWAGHYPGAGALPGDARRTQPGRLAGSANALSSYRLLPQKRAADPSA